MTTASVVTAAVSTTCLVPSRSQRSRGELLEFRPLRPSRLHQSSSGRLLAVSQAQWDGVSRGRIYTTTLRHKKSWKCSSDPQNSETDSSDATDVSTSGPPNCCNDATGQGSPGASVVENAAASSPGNSSKPEFESFGPGKRGNQLVAVASVTIAVGLFALGRVGGATPNLPQLAAQSTPYEEALVNGRPTVVEFYADWCEVCREMAKDVYVVEQEYKDKINFVMLNVDNTKWEGELDEFGVEGIPHFAFLDGRGNEEGNIVGRLPRKILKENLAALARGDTTIPHSRVVGKFSDADSRQAPPVVEPRSHGQLS
ncbi:hypothetical protein Mapa_005748 [Marchantia paleacea]|nr:hypothetical protein Mapa_005748 [Marchantia paleacea]